MTDSKKADALARHASLDTWVEITFHTAGESHCIENPVRMPYVKAGLLCVETREKDGAGRNVIVKYPLCNVFSVAVPHCDHHGMGARP